MDDLESMIIIKVFYENKTFDITTNVNMSLEEIKKKFAEKIKYNDKNFDKINLWYIDEDNDKNLINNSNDLIEYSNEIEFSKYSIILHLDINNKDNKHNKDNKDNKEFNKNEIEEEKEKEKNSITPTTTIININKFEDEKNEINKKDNEIKLLKDELSYYKERVKYIINYYENYSIEFKKEHQNNLKIIKEEESHEIKKKLQKEKVEKENQINNINQNEKIEKDNQNNINQNEINKEGNQININQNEKIEKENQINNINKNEKNEKENQNNINQNEINEEGNQINIINQNENIEKENQNNINQNEINEQINEKNIIDNLNKSKTIINKKNNKINEKKENFNDNKIEQVIKKIESKKKENIFSFLNENEGETPVFNNSLKENKKEYNLNKLEFVKYCKNCENISKKIIYKCLLCKHYFLCDICFKNRSKFHEHLDFYEIKYPSELIKQIQEKLNENLKLSKTVNSFYALLNNIFFDKKGNLVKKEINKSEIKNLKQICKDMKSINADPMEYYSEYKLVFINNEIQKLEEESKKEFSEKIKSFLFNLEEANNANK